MRSLCGTPGSTNLLREFKSQDSEGPETAKCHRCKSDSDFLVSLSRGLSELPESVPATGAVSREAGPFPDWSRWPRGHVVKGEGLDSGSPCRDALSIHTAWS